MRGSVRHHCLAPPANDSELGSQCGIVSLSGANPHGVLDIRDENLAVTDLARACNFMIASMTLSTSLVRTTTSTLTFGTKLTAFSVPPCSRS
jgi:hypothetical protein